MVDRDVTVDFNADVSGYTSSTTQAIALTKEYTGELDNLVGTVAKVGNTLSTGMVDSMAKLVRANEAGVSSAAAYQQQLSSLEGAVSVTTGNFGKLENQVKSLARELPVGIGGAVRQFEALQKVGVPTERIAGMAKAFTQLEGATGESGTALAQMSIQMSRTFNNQSLRGVQNLNDALVKTTREMGASASGTLSFANAIAPIAKQAGLSQTAVIGMSTAFSRVGEDGYRAANVLVKMMSDMDRSVRDGSSEMTGYANIVGKTRQEFTELYKANPAEAFNQIFEALNRAGPEGIRMLETIGLEGVRSMRAIQSVVSSGGLGAAMEMAQGAYGGGATGTAAEKAFGGLNDQLTRLSESMSQTVSSAGTPFLGFLEDVAQAASSVAEVFNRVASNDFVQTLVSVGGGLALTGSVAGGIGGIATGLGIGKGILGGTGAPGRSAAGFLANNRGKLLAAGVGGMALSGMGGGMGGLLLPALMAGSFIGPQSIRNIMQRGGEAFYTNVGQQAGMTLPGVARGEDIRRTPASRSYRAGQQLLRETGAGFIARQGFMATYARADPAKFAAQVDDILDAATDPNSGVTMQDARKRLEDMDSRRMQGGSRWRQGGQALGRAAWYGGGGALRGVGAAGMAMVGGVPGLAAIGGIGLGIGAYSAMERSNEFRREREQRREEGDTTSALNDFRTALGLTTVAAQDFASVLGGFADDVMSVDKTLKDAFELTEEEIRSQAGKTSTINFGGSPEQQAAQAMALIGQSSDKEYIDAIVTDLAASLQGDRPGLNTAMGMINEWQAGGRQNAAGYGIEAIGSAYERRGGWLNLTGTTKQRGGAPGADWNPLTGGPLGSWAITQFQGANEEQMAETTASAQVVAQDIMAAGTAGGPMAMQEQMVESLDSVADSVDELVDQAGVSSYNALPQATKEMLEEFVTTAFGLTDEEAAEFLNKASQGQEAATYVMNQTASGQAIIETALENDAKLRSGLQEAFDSFEDLRPVLEDVAASNLTLGEYLEENRSQLGVGEAAFLQSQATPGDLGARYITGRMFSQELMNAENPAEAFAEFQVQRGEYAQGSPERLAMDQGAAQYRQDRELARMSMSSTQADLDRIEQGRAAAQEIMDALESGQQLDEQVMTDLVADVDMGRQAVESQKQFMTQRIVQMREYNIQRERMTYDFNLNAERQEDRFYRQRGYAEDRFQRQQEYAEADYFRNRGRAVEDFNRSVERAEYDYRISVERAEADFYRNRRRMQADYQLSVARAEEDFGIQRARAFEDRNLSLEREAEDHAKRMARIAEDIAASFMDPFTRVGPEQTWSTGGLLRNIERQAELAQEQLATLDELRERGLSQGAIDTLNLSDPSMARQVSRMGGMSEEEIAQLNAATGDRLGIAEQYMENDRDIRRQEEDRKKSLARQEEDFRKSLSRSLEDFQKSLARGEEDFRKSMDRTAEDFRISLARGEEDFNKSLARNKEDFDRQLARSWEDFQIQTARAQEEFTISMDEQLTEFNISMDEASDDHQRTLDRMEEDLKRSGEQIHGDFNEIATTYFEMLEGDAEAYRKVTTDNVTLLREVLFSEISQVPFDVAFGLGDAAWMFGFGEFDESKTRAQFRKYKELISEGASGILAEAIASAQTAAPGVLAPTDGGAGGAAPTSQGGELFPGNHRVYTYPGHNPSWAWDIGTPSGTPIYAPFPGTLDNKTAGGGWSSYGQYFDFSGGGKRVRVAHLSRFAPEGFKAKGQLIGYTGGIPGVYGSGRSSGAHAHVEAYLYGRAVNPTRILKYDTGGVLEHGTTALNLSGKPEAIINNDQWKALRRLGEEISRLNAGVTMDPRGMGIVGEVIGRHLDAWEAKAARVSGYATAGGPSYTTQTYDHSTNVNGPVQVVSNDPVDMGRKMAVRSRRRRAYQPVGGRR